MSTFDDIDKKLSDLGDALFDAASSFDFGPIEVALQAAVDDAMKYGEDAAKLILKAGEQAIQNQVDYLAGAITKTQLDNAMRRLDRALDAVARAGKMKAKWAAARTLMATFRAFNKVFRGLIETVAG